METGIAEDGPEYLFIEYWHRACRALFSDDSLSLRYSRQLVKAYQDPAKRGTSYI